MKRLITALLMIAASAQFTAAEDPDSASLIGLNEVIVVEKRVLNYNIQQKPLSALDEYLEQAPGIGMIRRGSYAWEPMINGMPTERISVTIDGMHIFGACTDKMDPITSYVDVSNLSEVQIVSGQQGASFGPTVGGSINLARKQHDFCHEGWGLAFDAGLESNGLLQTYGTAIQYLHRRFYIDADFMFRKANDYKAGKKTEVPFSQFTKYNVSGTAGLHINDRNRLTAALIYDRAKDIGYPALPMDVALAQAQIASIEHLYERPGHTLRSWSSKIYFNHVRHLMDDTQRPNVLMHMDMPGKSLTSGVYSRINVVKGSHTFDLNLNGYHNRSLADMTMYPNDSEEEPMYMYTWPDVRTQYGGLNFEHRYARKEKHSFRYLAGLGWQRNFVANGSGLGSLQIFYPDMKAMKHRFLPATSLGYVFRSNGFEAQAGMGYGERAPSVSEGYGYYLFNSFDRYDYIGNPNLPNERSLEWNGALGWRSDKFWTKFSASYFRFFSYIIGITDPVLSVMTPGASGVRIYQSLDGASLMSAEFRTEYRPHPSWKLRSVLTYNLGRDKDRDNLPMVRPFGYRFGLAYKYRFFDAEISVEGASKQWAYSAKYGEDETPAYALLNLSLGYTLLRNDHRVYFRAGLENLANSLYSTYSDWNNIPAKGINAFFSISYVLDKKRDRKSPEEPVAKAPAP